MLLEQFLPLNKLDLIVARSDEFKSGHPFPHIIVDDFLPTEVYRQLVADFPGPKDHAWLRYKAPVERDKLQSTSELTMPSSIRAAIQAFNSSTFVAFVEKLTGINNIIPDPHLFGGGMHQTLPGGHLSLHVDYNIHNKWRLDRRLNAILYLNEGWEEEWGGALELWEGSPSEVRTCIKKIAPVGNRLVIFTTNEISWHGHPDPLACPPDRTRKSLAFYYYSNGRPEEERAAEHNTRFVGRPGETFPSPSGEKFLRSLKGIVHDWLPPVMFRALQRLRKKNAP